MPNQNVKDFKLLRNALINLAKVSQKHWNNNMNLSGDALTQKTRKNYISSLATLHPMYLGALYSRLKNGLDTLSLDLERIIMPPLRRKLEFIPLLSFKCCLGKTPPYISLRIEMYRSVQVEKKIELGGLGFRFETGDPEHKYYHVQLFGTARWPDLLPESDPCIPTTASCPVSLFICMIVSFYGVEVWKRFFSNITIEDRHTVRLKHILP